MLLTTIKGETREQDLRKATMGISLRSITLSAIDILQLTQMCPESRLAWIDRVSMRFPPTDLEPAHIKPVVPVRDNDGFWTHPDLPIWEDGTTNRTMNEWAIRSGGQLAVDFAQEGILVSDWEPTCRFEGSFLLSIHDTDDGLCAFFFVPFHVGE